ncbi:MAG: DUF4247 domain-containing protein [Gordonia sp. (in: high G+C Gram-positive bacteria)]|uniref:DUF4247 domain-containing protein n=1 Tax=Gordonia sp. (in: high G+C Gram-positive bacteria) TaxID=84139 RepID=UPI0039E652BD
MTPTPTDGPDRDPRERLRRIRNALILGICVVAVGAMIVTCAADGALGGGARKYIEQTYQRTPSLDEGTVAAYLAAGSITTVAAAIAGAEKPTDNRAGGYGVGNTTPSRFLQYPDYLVGLFPHAGDQTRVMVSKDYQSGYNHYHSYVGGYWVPMPRYSGGGNRWRGGGSGFGK